jgi:hypothetical protein
MVQEYWLTPGYYSWTVECTTPAIRDQGTLLRCYRDEDFIILDGYTFCSILCCVEMTPRVQVVVENKDNKCVKYS